MLSYRTFSVAVLSSVFWQLHNEYFSNFITLYYNTVHLVLFTSSLYFVVSLGTQQHTAFLSWILMSTLFACSPLLLPSVHSFPSFIFQIHPALCKHCLELSLLRSLKSYFCTSAFHLYRPHLTSDPVFFFFSPCTLCFFATALNSKTSLYIVFLCEESVMCLIAKRCILVHSLYIFFPITMSTRIALKKKERYTHKCAYSALFGSINWN